MISVMQKTQTELVVQLVVVVQLLLTTTVEK